MTSVLPTSEGSESLSRNVRVLALRSFLYGLQTNMVRAVWQPFVLHLGASMPFLGLLESVGGFQGIVSTSMLPLGGWLSDRRGRKPFVLLASLLAFAALATFALASWAGNWRVLIPGVVLLGLTAIARPVLDSITAESASPETRGAAFSRISMGIAVSGVFAPTLGGLLAQQYGFMAVFAAGAAVELVTLSVMALSLAETLPSRERAVDLGEFLRMLRRIAVPPRKLRSFYVAVAIDLFAFGTGSAILFGLLTSEFGFSPLQLGLMSSVHSATWAISQLFFGRQVDRRGRVPFLILSEILAMCVLAGWMVARSYAAFLVLHALLGVAVATWVPAFRSWVANVIPEDQRAEEIGRLGAFRGLVAFPAPYVGGVLYSRVGFRGPILANLVGAAIVVALLWRFVGEPEHHS
jgi:MFS family permease